MPDGFADKDTAVGIFAEETAAVRCHSAGGRMSSRMRQPVALHRDKRKHLRFFARRSDIGVADGNAGEWILLHLIQ